MPCPDLPPSSVPSLSERLRWRMNRLQSKIIRTNYNTQFAQNAPELADFRRATDGMKDGVGSLSEVFRKTVPFTTYDAYAPFLARFLDTPCKESAVVDLFAPGLPDYLAESSSTSGGLSKIFPKYDRLSQMRSAQVGLPATLDPPQRRTTAYVWYLGCDKMEVEHTDNCPPATIYLACGTVVTRRMRLNLDPEKDEEKMGTFICDHAAPYAAGFIKQWRSFLVIHVLFAVRNRSLETMSMAFLSTFVDMIRHLDTEFDMVVNAIENGTIPDLDGIADIRQYLESNMLPDPERAAELRALGRPSSRSGWCSLVWPNLRSVTSVASGTFASSIPLARWYLGPNTDICARGYGSTEVWIGSPYNALELNQFKPSRKNVIEFLDISKSDSTSSLAQLWEVEVGKQYELVLTTKDGLWRYRLGDVVDIAGFDPTDGVPIIQFVERRNVAIRFPDFMVTEKELRAAISAVAPDVLVHIVDWTTAIDDRCVPATIGFFIELAGDHGQVPETALARAPDHLLDALALANENIPWALDHTLIRKPTLRLVQRGTFSAFRQHRVDEGAGLGQVKVPVVLPKAEYVTWLSERVVCEVGCGFDRTRADVASGC